MLHGMTNWNGGIVALGSKLGSENVAIHWDCDCLIYE